MAGLDGGTSWSSTADNRLIRPDSEYIGESG